MSESLRASPSSPLMVFFFARGWTLTAKVEPWLLSLIGMLILVVVSFSATRRTGAIETRGLRGWRNRRPSKSCEFLQSGITRTYAHGATDVGVPASRCTRYRCSFRLRG